MSFRPLRVTYEEIRREADEFLSQYHPDVTAPVPIEAIVEFDLSMDVRPVVGLKEEIGVDAFLTNNLEWIYCDEWVMSFAPARYRFSLAHEVGHWWLHDKLYTSTQIESVTDFKRVLASISVEDYSLFEAQANGFAGLILAPNTPLSVMFRQLRARASQAGVPQEQLDHQPTRGFMVREIARAFELSEAVVEIRLERDGLLPKLPRESDFG